MKREIKVIEHSLNSHVNGFSMVHLTFSVDYHISEGVEADYVANEYLVGLGINSYKYLSHNLEEDKMILSYRLD